MRFDDNDQYTPDLSEGSSPEMNFDTTSSSFKTSFILFLNEDFNYLLVKT